MGAEGAKYQQHADMESLRQKDRVVDDRPRFISAKSAPIHSAGIPARGWSFFFAMDKIAEHSLNRFLIRIREKRIQKGD